MLGISPPVEGLDAEVLNFDDRIEVRNSGNETVVVEGYRGEPYLRFEPDGTVSVNQRSPATYLNEDCFADVEVPDAADPRAAPEWLTIVALVLGALGLVAGVAGLTAARRRSA